MPNDIAVFHGLLKEGDGPRLQGPVPGAFQFPARHTITGILAN
jgi:hypothetical protein